MAKSKARFLAEILGSDGKVQKGKSKGFEQIALSDLPTITNAKLQNSAVTFAGETASLGGSASLNTGDITEHTNYKYYTDARSRGSISASLASGHGAVSYNSTTGALSITGVSTEAIQDVVGAMFSSNTESGITVTYDDNDGTIDLSVTALNTDSVSEGSSNLYHTTARARAAISATGSLSYNSTTGVMSFTMPAQNTSNITEGSNLYFTNARAISAVTGSDLDMSGRKVLFGNMYSAENNLPSASTYHGMFAHVHGTGKGYFAHGGNWIKLLDESSSTTANLTEGSNLYYTTSRVNAAIDARVTQSMVNALGINATHLNSSTGGSYALKASPALTGTPTAPTAAANTNTTQIATTAYVQTELTDLIDGAPGTLDSLNELAAAINDDSNYNSTLTTALATKVNKTSNQALGNAANVMTISGNTITLARGDSTTDTVTVPDTNTTYSTATSSALGLVKIGYSENGKNYPVELSSGKMFVNVPWVDTNTDTNTTYTGGTNISLSGTTFNLDNEIVLSTGVAGAKGAFGSGMNGVHATYHLYNNNLTYLNGATIIDDNLTISGGGAILGSPNITAGRVITSGLYGTTHGSSTLPIWQYDASNPGYGIAYTESSPDVLRFDVSGNLMSGTADLELRPNELKVNGNVVYHVGNDGSGSGLDADLLDGQHASAFLTSFTETNAFIGDGGSGSTHPGTSRGVYSGQLSQGTAVLGMPTTDNSNSILTFNRHSGNYNSQIGFSSNGSMYYRSFSNAAINNSLSWRKVWDSGNDGSGSGLDADTVDGVHLSGLARLDHDNAGEIRGTNFKALNGGVYYAYTSAGNLRGYIYATETNDEHLVLRTSGGEDIAFKDDTTTNMIVRGDGTMWLRDKIDIGGDLNLGTSGTGNTLNAKYGQIIGGFGAITTGGTTDWNHSTNARSGSGHTLLYGNATNGPDSSLSGKYYHPFSFEYASYDGDGNMAQFAIPYAHNDAGPYFRTRYSGTWGGWVELWHSGNDGAGSGLDADHLDGVTWASQTKAVAARNLTIEAGDGQGIGFWGGTGTVLGGSYAIAMASQGNGNAGRHSLDSSSDYNMYFKMSGGTDRGFVFKNSGSNVAAITSGGRFLGSAVYLDGSSSQNQYVAADSTHSLTVRNMGATTSGGLVLQGSSGTHGLQMYWDTGGYGFLDGAWADWDIQKVPSGAFKVDEGSGLKRVLNEANWSSYISVPSSSTFATLSGSNSFTNVYNEFGNNTGAVSNDGSWNARVNISGTSHARLDLFEDADDSKLRLFVHSGSAAHIGTTSSTSLEFETGGTTRMLVHSSGYVQIKAHNNGWDGGLRMVSSDGTDTYKIHPDDNGYMYADKTWNFSAAPHVGIGNPVWHTGNDGSGSGLDADTVDGVHVSHINRGANTSGVFPGASGYNLNDVFTGTPRAGFIDAWSGSNFPPGTTHIQGIQTRHATSTHYGWQLFGQYNQAGKLYHRQVSNNSWGSWSTIWSSANDGSGSGLDADLFDGQDSAVYFKSPSNVSGWQNSNANFSVRAGNATNVGLHMEESDGGFGFQLYSAGGTYGFLDSEWGGWDIQKVPNSTFKVDEGAGLKRVLNEANWSSYITLPTDANTIDGIGFVNTGSNSAQNADTIASNGISYYTSGVPNFSGNASDGALYSQVYSSSWQHQIAGDYRSGQIALRGKNNGTWQSWRKVWDESNDGSGSGLDADTLDGYQLNTARANVANRVVATDSNGYIQAGWINSTSGDMGSGVPTARVYCSNDGYVRYVDLASFRSLMNSPARSGSWYQGREQSTTDTNYWVGTMGYGTVDFNTVFRYGSGFIDSWSNPGNQPSNATSHWVGNQSLHYTNGSADYGWQMLMGAGTNGLLYVRGKWNSAGSWSKVWNDANDGSGSGLDADLLDGLQSAANGNDIVLRTNSNGYLDLNDWMNVGGQGIYSSTTNGAHWYPNTANSYGTWRMNGSRGGYSGIYHNNGGGVVSSMYDSGGNGGDYYSGSWHFYYHRGNDCIGLAASTTSSSYGAYVTGALYATGDVVGSSDRRLKKNINTIENGLAKVEKLRGVTYEWKDTKESGSEGNNVTPERMGVIAQEIVDIVPEVVTHDKENDRYGVSYGHLTGVLIEAIKELSDKVKDLEKKLEEK